MMSSFYEEHYLGREFIGYGDILQPPNLSTKADLYTAVATPMKRGQRTILIPMGCSRQGILRAPVEIFSGFSSSFNLRRKHPLYKTVRSSGH